MKIVDQFPIDHHFEHEHPLTSGSFHKLLEASQSVGVNTGWNPFHLLTNDCILPGYIKEHSYGEYIFDWSWANTYHKYGVPYYPKLIHALPFTPINAPKLMGNASTDLFEISFHNYLHQEGITGEHYLFVSKQESKQLQNLGFIEMKSIQYHFKNEWDKFDDFLSTLKTSRRKMIKKERKKINQYKLSIEFKTGQSLNEELLKDIYLLYLSTIDKKQSHAYLTENFFCFLPNFLRDETLIITASKDDELIAMALFFVGQKALYGRYWGIKPNYRENFPLLHFEMCYYLGMEYCMQKKIPLFEAGAQGEQKLWRGFRPVEIYSAHHIRLKPFFEAIKKHVEIENKHIEESIKELTQLLPYLE